MFCFSSTLHRGCLNGLYIFVALVVPLLFCLGLGCEMWSINPQKPVIMRCFDHICWDHLRWYRRAALPSKFLGRCCWMPGHWLPEQIWKWRKVSWIQRRFTNQNGEACVWKHPKSFRFQIFSWPTRRYNKMMHHFLKWANKNQHIPKKENHPAIQSELDSPSVDLEYKTSPFETGWIHQGVSNMF